ncbi:MAG: Flp pilus assembly complex ATPase component TadA [Phycisphaerae bacterium]|nr:Flp pilus assembly complex ATPase component TadA [Phycisphaerae bacterium]
MKEIFNKQAIHLLFDQFQKNHNWHIDDDRFDEELLCENEEVTGLTDLYQPQRQTQKQDEISKQDKPQQQKPKDIADILLEMNVLNQTQYEQIRHRQKTEPARELESIIVSSGTVSDDSDLILEAKAKLLEIDFKKLDPEQIDKSIFEKLDINFIRTNQICPVSIESNTLVLAAVDPINLFVIEDASRRTSMDVKVIACGKEDIELLCNYFTEEKNEHCLDEIINDMGDLELVKEEKKDFEDLEKMAGQSPVIKFVNYLITNAIHEGASDIHIEPKNKVTKIRYRIDGILFESMESPLKMHSAVVSRIKIMSNLDISERRLPQDGKISVIASHRQIDLRVSTLPTSHGEKVVVRILDSNSILRGLGDLGMSPEMTEAFKNQISMPHGIMLVTGPTGSGKSTTLYSALAEMDSEKLNVSTVEDPVEYELGFCNQVQVNEKIGMTFASALRSLLRQDPDIIMIGEIRDEETAKIAVQSALTGHLVLSTLHTNDAPSSITRLVNIGIDPYLIAASLNCVIAQRLVRKICPKCKEPYDVPERLQKLLQESDIDSGDIYHGRGCEACRNSGYSGRVGIYEMLTIDDIFRKMINKDTSVNNMRKAFHENGCKTLFDDGLEKIKKGQTTMEEILRVTQIN